MKTILWPVISILTLAIVPVLAACAPASTATTPAPLTTEPITPSTSVPALENTTWVLQSYGLPGNLKSVLKGSEITAVFDGTSSRVAGSAGVNGFGGGYELKDNNLSIPGSTLAVTLMAGPQPLMDQEKAFLDLFQAAESYKIDGVRLTITCGSQELVFTRK